MRRRDGFSTIGSGESGVRGVIISGSSVGVGVGLRRMSWSGYPKVWGV